MIDERKAKELAKYAGAYGREVFAHMIVNINQRHRDLKPEEKSKLVYSILLALAVRAEEVMRDGSHELALDLLRMRGDVVEVGTAEEFAARLAAERER